MRARKYVLPVAAATLLSCLVSPQSANASSASIDISQRGFTSAKALLNQIPTRAPRTTGYKRTLFKHWTSIAGCDTRNRVLASESRVKVTRSGNCRVLSGRWQSAFDGAWFMTPGGMDVDHMVPLSEAWQSGAFSWNADTRTRFANDIAYPGSLIAVSASANRSKGDKDPAKWLPNARSYVCTYVKTWVAVKYRWRLSADAIEKAAINSRLNNCALAMLLPPRAVVVVAPSKPSQPAPVYYANCAAVRAAGKAPLYRGQPGYRSGLDRDNDGVACE